MAHSRRMPSRTPSPPSSSAASARRNRTKRMKPDEPQRRRGRREGERNTDEEKTSIFFLRIPLRFMGVRSLLREFAMTEQERLDTFNAHVASGGKVEPGDWMPDAYR